VEKPGVAPPGEEDARWLRAVREGEPAAAAQLFERYATPLFRYAHRMLGNRDEAEEVAQDVFLKMISRADQYDGRASVASWLFAIAANSCRDRLRRAARRPVLPLESVPEVREGDDPVDVRLAERQRRQAVRRALSKLSNEQREALVLARYHGLPYAEIARTLKISEGAVKTRIFRATEALRDLFSEGDSPWNAATP